MNEDFNRRLAAALEALQPSLDKAGAAPVGPADAAPTKSWLTPDDQDEMRRSLKKLETHEIWSIFSRQARKEGQGLPLDIWMQSNGGRTIDTLMNENPTVRKALDTTGGSALIRQDLEPLLYELFIRDFPAWDRFPKEPANGLVHAYNRMPSYGDAQFMPELGTVTDDTAVGVRPTGVGGSGYHG